MKIAILGFARDGQAAFDFFKTQGGHDITICDQDDTKVIPDGATAKLGDDHLKELDQYDKIVRTAGLHPRLIQEANPESPDILEKVTGNIDLFYEHSPSQNIIGVTGTKGKGTTSTLISEMLKKAGKTVHLGGNIGIPALELLKENIQPEDWVVLEQSSFQLIDQKHSPKIGVCLMVVPEHLDWHADLDEYIDAKSQLFIHQTPDDIAIYYTESETSEDIASASEGTLVPYYRSPGAEIKNGEVVIGEASICKTDEIKLLGKHNWQNVCAAVTAVWQIVQDREAAREVLTTFTGLPYHLELVREVESVRYYNDSFGTTPETAMVAIESFDQPKVVILGGSSKNSDYSALAELIAKSNIRCVITIGATADQIATNLQSKGYSQVKNGGSTMAEIVEAARAEARPGDVVLLSPACASFGLFTDYKDRGQQFTKAVQALA
jgi:UDP-N-acetylmuramoylalanine--D-glutamate ligase